MSMYKDFVYFVLAEGIKFKFRHVCDVDGILKQEPQCYVGLLAMIKAEARIKVSFVS